MGQYICFKSYLPGAATQLVLYPSRIGAFAIYEPTTTFLVVDVCNPQTRLDNPSFYNQSSHLRSTLRSEQAHLNYANLTLVMGEVITIYTWAQEHDCCQAKNSAQDITGGVGHIATPTMQPTLPSPRSFHGTYFHDRIRIDIIDSQRKEPAIVTAPH